MGNAATVDEGLCPVFHRYVMAVDRVEKLLHDVGRALDAAGIEYAVIGGNAVAAWVSTVDDGAVRSTKDVDILLRRGDLAGVEEALQPIGLIPAEVLGVTMFIDRDRPSPKTGVHVVIANELIRAHYTHAAPDPRESTRLGSGLSFVDLSALLRMKLQSYRDIDRVHVRDLMSVELITHDLAATLPPDLRERLDEIRRAPE